jgi:hypothetical protein
MIRALLAARRPLTLLDGRAFITDGGMETTFIFRDGREQIFAVWTA